MHIKMIKKEWDMRREIPQLIASPKLEKGPSDSVGGTQIGAATENRREGPQRTKNTSAAQPRNSTSGHVSKEVKAGLRRSPVAQWVKTLPSSL